jgi:hypothetical protein
VVGSGTGAELPMVGAEVVELNGTVKSRGSRLVSMTPLALAECVLSWTPLSLEDEDSVIEVVVASEEMGIWARARALRRALRVGEAAKLPF